MNRSCTGMKFTSQSGILQLMDDLGKALAGTRKKYMLGGGNPALIPEIAAIWRSEMRAMLDDEQRFDQAVGRYDTPQGRPAFLAAVAGMLNAEYGWDLTADHIAVTNGSQSAFFMLFNLLAGNGPDGSNRRILFPLMPEYIGYSDQALGKDDFVGVLPTIERIDDHTHKYHVDFDALRVDDDIAAICVSRPTNPTGNVLTNAEIDRLDRIARAKGIPLIVDNAYGAPFPDIIFTDSLPVWNDNVVLAMSLSKIGLPSLRTGILVARPDIVQAVVAMNAVVNLATGGMGQALTERLFASGAILHMSREIVRPFYRRRCESALACVHASFADRFPWSVHRPEGSLFLWLWFPELPGTTTELYERLKARDVVVVPGRYFSFGCSWDHTDRCIRINYAMDEADVEHGIAVIAEEVERMWS